MKVYCITTGKEERLHSIKDQITFDFDFYYAKTEDVCLKDLSFDQNKSKNWRRKGLNRREVSCFHSHLTLWKMCYEAKTPFFIFEDNVELVRHVDSLDIEKAAVYGLVSFAQKTSYETITPHYRRMFYTRAYVISPGAAFRLYNAAMRQPVFLPVDSFISLWYLTKVRGYLSENPFFTRKSRSEIASLVGNDKPTRERIGRMSFFRFGFITTRIYRLIMPLLLSKHVI
ncbi:glycosyltransferase family 25 protein [Vibrio lentus]|uniref:Glycosyl transferase family 25 domain-containing protein n=1 Tax=Vibrio lentus TaxID=136468 RepID=A0A2N7K8I0_9VIBR|nr:glycosyltransferase family 25 protein [Vibrio lentus]PMM70892.1 hypothetical protein BCT49_00320 [Vibrio lentus]